MDIAAMDSRDITISDIGKRGLRPFISNPLILTPALSAELGRLPRRPGI